MVDGFLESLEDDHNCVPSQNGDKDLGDKVSRGWWNMHIGLLEKMVTHLGMTILTLRKLFLLMILIATFSMLLTYQIGKYLPKLVENTDIILVKEDSAANFDGNQLVQKLSADKKLRYDPVGNIVKSGNMYNFQNQRKLALSYKSSQVLSKLLQLEDKLSTLSRLAAIVLKDKSENGSQILSEMLKHLDYKVKHTGDRELLKFPHKENWSMVWMFNKGDNSDNSIAGKYQKMNYIKVLQDAVNDSTFPCQIQQTANFVLLDESQAKVSCHFVQPKLTPEQAYLKNSMNSTTLIWKPISSNLDQIVIASSIKILGKTGILWNIPTGLMKFDDHPIYLRLSLLVTSFLPLRVYLHSNVNAYKYKDGLTIRKDIRSVWHVRQSVQQTYGSAVAHSWWNDLHTALLISLLTAEYNTWNLRGEQEICSCKRCFQNMKVDVTFTSKFKPIIVQMLPEWVPTDREILEDGVAITAARGSVATDVAMAMDNLRQDIDFNIQNCEKNFGICISEKDLIYFLDGRRETLAPVSFLKLYPSRTSQVFTDISDRFRQLSLLKKAKTLDSIAGNSKLFTLGSESGITCHPTLDLHAVTSSLENLFLAYDGQSKRIGRKVASKDFVISRKLEVKNEDIRDMTGSSYRDLFGMDPGTKKCSDDPAHLPFLSSITIDQSTLNLTTANQSALKMTPVFSSGQLNYMLTVDYDVFVLKVKAVAKSCLCEVRFDNLFGSIGSSVYTIGLGENTVRIHVVDNSNVESHIVNTYTITVLRQERGISHVSPKYSVCSLKQDCSLKYSPKEPCGLQPVREFSTWESYQYHQDNKLSCKNQQILYASWYVPCQSCSEVSTCHWRSAVWNPNTCLNGHVTRKSLQECFAGKRIMFIGDSTNRGSLHYMIEKINGSLLDWDKTHNLKLYPNINNNKTVMSFVYYPQFWLPSNHRPAFDKAVFQLIKRTLPLENNNNTVLVVGGVHWLGKQHLDFILKALQREQLTKIKLIVKGLGAGFHQQVNGVHFLSREDQQKLLQRETDISNYGRKIGFHVIETFNMTMARYKDFLPGKCACHFHKVESINENSNTKYHVTGDINAAYTNQIINHICNFPT